MEVLVIYTWGTPIVARCVGESWDLERWDGDLLGFYVSFGRFEANFRGLRRGLENGRGRGEGSIINFIGRDGAKGGGGFERQRGGLGFVWLYANAERPEQVQLFEGLGIGAVDGSFVAIQQVKARAVGEALERVGEAILVVGFATDVGIGKKAFDVIDGGLHFVGEQGGFYVGEAAQAPAGGGHGFDQLDLDGAGGGEFVEIGIEEEMEVGDGFVGEDYGDGREGGIADGESVATGVLG